MMTIRMSRLIYISLIEVYECGLVHGNYMHVFNDKGKWYFFHNHEPTGFHILRSHAKRHEPGFHVYSAALISILLDRTKLKIHDSFIVRPTTREYEGFRLHE